MFRVLCNFDGKELAEFGAELGDDRQDATGVGSIVNGMSWMYFMLTGRGEEWDMIEKFKKDEAARKKREEEEAATLEAPPSDAVSAAPVISGPAQVRLAPPPPLAPAPVAAPGAAAAKAEALRVAALSSATRPPSPMMLTDAEKAALSGASSDAAVLAMISKKRTEVRSQSSATECVSAAPDHSLIPTASNHAGKESAERVQAGVLMRTTCAHAYASC